MVGRDGRPAAGRPSTGQQLAGLRKIRRPAAGVVCRGPTGRSLAGSEDRAAGRPVSRPAQDIFKCIRFVPEVTSIMERMFWSCEGLYVMNVRGL